MPANKLILNNFRNYTEQSIEFGNGTNIIYGDNAQGKTNILEAVFMFSMGKSNRARKDAELIRHGQEEARITLEFSSQERDCTGEICLFKNRRKTISVNDIPLRLNSELIGRFQVVYFGPEYLGLVKEGPKQRRRNTDILISQLKPGYFAALSNLKKIVESKNALLKMDRPNKAMLEILNEKLAAVSTEIISCRSLYLEKLSVPAKEIQYEISSSTEDLELRYMSCIGDVKGLDEKEIKSRLDNRLAEAFKRELDTREAAIGPHREDIDYYINGLNAKQYASQGQQKTIVLVQKLAEVELTQAETGELPVLLLDDIMSELDKKRRSFILNHIQKTQLLITCTDTDGFSLPSSARLFRVTNGIINAE